MVYIHIDLYFILVRLFWYIVIVLIIILLKTPCSVDTAAPAFGPRRVVIRFSSCGGWRLEGVSVQSLICMVLGGLLAVLGKFLAVFVCTFCDVFGASGTRNECKKRCLESLKTIQKWAWKRPKITKMWSRGVLGVSWEHSFHERIGAHAWRWNVEPCWRHLVEFESFWGALWISKGPIRQVFLKVFGAVTKTRKICISQQL